jgi:hypothetical protein
MIKFYRSVFGIIKILMNKTIEIMLPDAPWVRNLADSDYFLFDTLHARIYAKVYKVMMKFK